MSWSARGRIGCTTTPHICSSIWTRSASASACPRADRRQRQRDANEERRRWRRSGRRPCSPTSTRHIYGGRRPRRVSEPGAGQRIALEVRCFGEQRSDAPTSPSAATRPGPRPRRIPTRACRRARCLLPLAGDGQGYDRCRRRPLPHLVHRHGGLLASRLWDVLFVLSIHSLEPLRPWKVEQLGNGYHLSTWMERTAMEHADAIVAGPGRPARTCSACSTSSRRGSRHSQRHRPGRVPADRRHRRARATASIRPGPTSCSSAGSRVRRASSIWSMPSRDRSRPADRALRRRARHARDRPRNGGARGRGPRQAAGVIWIREMLPRTR